MEPRGIVLNGPSKTLEEALAANGYQQVAFNELAPAPPDYNVSESTWHKETPQGLNVVKFIRSEGTCKILFQSAAKGDTTPRSPLVSELDELFPPAVR